MRTTVEISDDLLAEAKRLARERDLTLRELIECGLRKELRAREAAPERFVWRHKPYGNPNAKTWLNPPFSEDYWGPIREASYERDEGE